MDGPVSIHNAPEMLLKEDIFPGNMHSKPYAEGHRPLAGLVSIGFGE